MILHIIIPGEPVAQARARFSSRNGFTRSYDPKKSADYKNYIRRIANQIKTSPLTGPLVMKVNVYRSVPKSWTKKKQLAALEGTVKPDMKPDVSNYLKGIEDALNGIAYIDDSQIVLAIVKKAYSANPRVEIRIWNDTDENNEKYYRNGEV